jgi:hypothetical protein
MRTSDSAQRITNAITRTPLAEFSGFRKNFGAADGQDRHCLGRPVRSCEPPRPRANMETNRSTIRGDTGAPAEMTLFNDGSRMPLWLP